MITITQLIAAALSKSKTGLVNYEIATIVQQQRHGTNAQTIDSTLSAATKKGVINKTPTLGTRGNSKFVYSVPKQPSISSVILQTLKNKTRIDSLEILQIVRSVRWNATKTEIDNSLFKLAANGKIIKSKSLMTDRNVISTQSKYVYTGI